MRIIRAVGGALIVVALVGSLTGSLPPRPATPFLFVLGSDLGCSLFLGIPNPCDPVGNN